MAYRHTEDIFELIERNISSLELRDQSIDDNRDIPVALTLEILEKMVEYIRSDLTDSKEEVARVIRYALEHKLVGKSINIRDLKIYDQI